MKLQNITQIFLLSCFKVKKLRRIDTRNIPERRAIKMFEELGLLRPLTPRISEFKFKL